MTSYNDYKYFNHLLQIEKNLEIILSKHVKNIIFKYIKNLNSGFYLDNENVKLTLNLENESLKFNMYHKKLDKWSNGNIVFSFNFEDITNVGNVGNVGIGTTFPNPIANIGIISTIQ
tara:strand:- start:1553 stop:1903 length:351 start_codon:yes stop_codon:yes gene_type:complete